MLPGGHLSARLSIKYSNMRMHTASLLSSFRKCSVYSWQKTHPYRRCRGNRAPRQQPSGAAPLMADRDPCLHAVLLSLSSAAHPLHLGHHPLLEANREGTLNSCCELLIQRHMDFSMHHESMAASPRGKGEIHRLWHATRSTRLQATGPVQWQQL